MIVDGQCYITYLPGEEAPSIHDDSIEYYDHLNCKWLMPKDEYPEYLYRKPVTEAEYKAHHWCIAHGDEMPEGHEVLRFGRPIPGDIVMCPGGRLYTYRVGDCWVNGLAPILRKKACEHGSTVCQYKYDGDVAVGYECLNCGMVRKLGDWE